VSRGRHARGVNSLRARTGLRRFLAPVVLIVCALVLASGTAAFAYFMTSASGTAQAQAITLGTPGGGSATDPTPASLNLSWGASSGLPTGGGYVVLRSTSKDGAYSKVSGGECSQSDTAASPTTTCTDNDPLLVPGTTYFYEVEAAFLNGSTMWVSALNAPFSGTTTGGTPSISTAATPARTTVGGSVSDQATLSGGYNTSGTIIWSLYNNASCAGPPVFTSSPATVTGDGVYSPSSSYAVIAIGSYSWAFRYSGDANNNPLSACGGVNEVLTVTQATPGLATGASSNANGTVTDAASLSDGYNPTGTITYTLYGPSATASCTAADTVTSVTNTAVSGNGSYTSPPITPPSPGTYWWITSYGGDANNAAVANVCGQSGESSVIGPVTPTITTTATPTTVTAGSSVADQAAVSGGDSPTGTITWRLYKSASCTGSPVFTTSGGGTVSGNNTYTSNSYALKTAGTYIWAFTYTGDKNNNAVSGCGGASETVTVSLALKPSMLPAAMVGQSYDCGTVITASGGAAPYTYAITAGSLPPGLILNPTTGAITGTPTAGGTFTFTVTATDSAGPPHNTGTKAYTLTVNPPIIAIGPCTLPDGTVGIPVGPLTLSAVGGTRPYTYSVSSGILPTGLTLNASTGAISGTPTAAETFWFTIKATDASTGTGPYAGSRSYAVIIKPRPTNHAPTITSARSAFFTTGRAGSFNVTTTGTPTPALTNANFGTCANSALPPGVTFISNGNGAGIITSKTFSPAGSTTICLNATNGVSPNAYQRFTLTIGTRRW
jgi:Putative Ig domain